MSDLEALINAKLAGSQANISAQKEQIAQMANQPKQVDLTPLMALADAWSDTPRSNLAQAYQAVKPRDNSGKMQALQQQLMQQEQGLTGDYISLLRLQDAKAKAAEKDKKSQTFEAMPVKDQQRIRTDISKSDDYKKMRSIADLQASTKKYRDLVNKHGFQVTGKNKKSMDSAYADLKIKYKEAAKLGALTGPDVALVEEGVAPSTGLKGVFAQAFGGGKEGVLNSIDQMQKTFGTDFSSAEESLRNTFPLGSDEQIGSVRSMFDKHQIANEEKKEESSETKEHEGVIYKKVGNKWVEQ